MFAGTALRWRKQKFMSIVTGEAEPGSRSPRSGGREVRRPPNKPREAAKEEEHEH